MLCWLLLGIGSTLAQTKINIRLLDSIDKIPIAKATVLDESGKAVFISDDDGMLEIAEPADERKFMIKHIGYHDYDLTLGGEETSRQFSLLLSPKSFNIDEVAINTGYQTIPRDRSTGAFSSVSNRQLQERIEPNILDRLEGIAPGLQFDRRRSGTAQMNIRGINKLSSGGISPLIIVDNFPYEGNLANINPNDVESVNILKDAVATSIWGARAGNGVIVINLKKPQGNFTIDATANTSIKPRPDLAYHQTMSSEDFIIAERFLYDSGFYNPYLTSSNSKVFVFSPVVSLLHAVDNDEISANEAEALIENYKKQDYREDLKKYFYRNELSQQYSVSAAMSKGNLGYRSSLGYDNSAGSQRDQQGKRISFLSSAYFEPTEKVRLELTTSYNNRISKGSLAFPNYPINPGGYKTELYPYARLVDDDGNGLQIPYRYNMDYVAAAESKGLLDWTYSPYDDLDKSMSETTIQYLSFTPRLQYSPFPGVSFSTIYNYEQQFTRIRGLYTKESFYVRDMVNRYTDMSSGTPKHNLPYGDILNLTDGNMSSHKFRLQGNIDKTLKERHYISALMGSEFTAVLNTGSTDRLYGYDPNKLTVTPVDYRSIYPMYDGLGAASTIPFLAGITERRTRFISLYANGSYSYAKRYTLSFSARKDASNVFGVKANDQWNPLWSIGGAWTMTNEDWFPAKQLINNLRLRITHGHSGNSGGLVYTDVIMGFLSPERYYGMPYGRILSPPNPNLKWEDVAQTNFAIDFNLFNGRLNGNVDIYRKSTTDLVSNDPADPTIGFSNVDRNVASIKGRGVDVQLNGLIVDRNLKWRSTLFFTYNKDIVAKYNGAMFQGLNYASGGGKNISPIVDYVLYPVFSYRFEGLNPENGNPIGFYDGERTENYADILRDSVERLNYHGSGLPLVHGSFSNSVGWKGLELSFTVAFKFSSYFMKPTIRYMSLMDSWGTHADFSKRWQKPGDEAMTTVPSFIYPTNSNRDSFYAYSSANVERGDLLRLQNVKLSYTLHSKNFKQRIGINRMTVYASINNIGLLWAATDSGYDPDFSGIPTPRNFNMGINLHF